MTTWSSLHTDEAVLLGRVYFKSPGTFNATVPAGAKYVRAMAEGCGGQGDHWGGSGAFARSVVTVTAGDNLAIQVGNTSQSSVLGDSFVKRNDGSVICYADRGRGNSNAGLAANSIGDVTRDGQPGIATGVGGGGDAPSDAADYDPMGFVGLGARGNSTGGTLSAGPGGGGHLFASVNNVGDSGPLYAVPAGPGRVCLEYFDSNPGS